MQKKSRGQLKKKSETKLPKFFKKYRVEQVYKYEDKLDEIAKQV